MATAKRRASNAPRIYNIKGRMLSGAGEYSPTFKFIVLAILTVGIYYLWKQWKEAQEAKTAAAGQVPAGNTTPTLPAGNTTPQLPASSAPKEVENSYFQTYPFAYASTNGSSLNVRSAPSDKATAIASIANGAYIGRHTGFSADSTPGNSSTRWAKVTLQDGRTGWVFSAYIKSEKAMRSSFTAKPKEAVSVPRKAGAIIGRDAFARNEMPVGKLETGKRYAIISTSGDWAKIAEGFVPKKAIVDGKADYAAWIQKTVPTLYLKKGDVVPYTEKFEAERYGTIFKLENGKFIGAGEIQNALLLGAIEEEEQEESEVIEARVFIK